MATLLTTTAGACAGRSEDAPSSDPTHASAAARAAGSDSDSDLPKSLTRQHLDWKDCPKPSSLQGGEGGRPRPLSDGTKWSCATLKAPLDYRKPKGKTIGIQMIRAKSKAKGGHGGKRIGSLLFNFGGPGGSGVTLLPSLAKEYKKLHARYDLVSFDPRGVGNSDGVRCLSDKGLDASYALDDTPDDSAEEKALLGDVRKTRDACEKKSGKLLPHVGTENAARDMDLMRQVLGDDKLYYFGVSYGTELGGVYAHLFPKHLGRAVLDAVVDPTEDPKQSALGQAKGFQLALDNFLQKCAQQGSDCPTGADPARGVQRITALLKRLDKKPLPTATSRKLTQSRALNGIAQALYSKDYWPYLQEGLDEAAHGSGNMLLALSDSMTGRDRNGHYSNAQAANTAITCADSKQRYDVKDVKAALPEFRAASPVFGEFLAWGMLECEHWPVKGTSKTPDVRAPDAAPILLIGNTGDPATPYEGAQRMAQELGPGVGVAITYQGQGHGAYGNSRCVTDTVNRYLLDGVVPSDGKVCS
nr:alpha/beta hydrolase [Streptomyces sp. TP-A0874]